MPILIAVAAAFALWLPQRWPRARPAAAKLRPLLWGTVAALASLALSASVRDIAPHTARLLHAMAWLALIALPFGLAARLVERRHLVIAVAAGLTLLAVTVRLARDQSWHERTVAVSAAAGAVEQEIDLDATAVARLRAAQEVYLVVDLTAPDGIKGLRLRWSGSDHEDATLAAAMPRMGEATVAGGRNPRSYPQWWSLRVSPDWLPAGATTLRIGLHMDGDRTVTLRADRHRDQQQRYDGPSFGDWPHYSTAKLEHTGDYRLPASLPIESTATRSFRVLAGGKRVPLRSVLRIRLLVLANDEGYLTWETGPAPAGPACFSFFAHNGRQGEATLTVAGAAGLTFPLASAQDFVIETAGQRLCYHPGPSRDSSGYGEFALVRDSGAAGTARCEVRFLTGMSLEPMHFSVDRGRADGTLCGACSHAPVAVVNGVLRITDASRNSYPWDEGGGWSVAAVY
jgi:hypothetical protein